MHWLPFAGGWTRHRDFPVPDRQTFQVQWAQSKKAEARAKADAEAVAKPMIEDSRESAP
jgi:L-lactate dehydrogenase complex protein LldF